MSTSIGTITAARTRSIQEATASGVLRNSEGLASVGKISVMPAATGHYVFKEPSNPDIKIWRYMDFAKYVSFLESSALWFSRIDKLNETFEGKLGDPFEGT